MSHIIYYIYSNIYYIIYIYILAATSILICIIYIYIYQMTSMFEGKRRKTKPKLQPTQGSWLGSRYIFICFLSTSTHLALKMPQQMAGATYAVAHLQRSPVHSVLALQP